MRDLMGGQIVGKEEPRTKILSLSSGTLLVYQLPDRVELDAMRFVADEPQLTVTDGRGFTMNLTEVIHGGRL